MVFNKEEVSSPLVPGPCQEQPGGQTLPYQPPSCGVLTRSICFISLEFGKQVSVEVTGRNCCSRHKPTSTLLEGAIVPSPRITTCWAVGTLHTRTSCVPSRFVTFALGFVARAPTVRQPGSDVPGGLRLPAPVTLVSMSLPPFGSHLHWLDCSTRSVFSRSSGFISSHIHGKVLVLLCLWGTFLVVTFLSHRCLNVPRCVL